jgi:hypothetical protein
MPDPHDQSETRQALRADVGKFYDAAGCCVDTDLPTLTGLLHSIPPEMSLSSASDILEWAILGLGGSQRTKTAFALLGVYETRGLSKKKRWAKCAELSDNKYKTGDSFRNGRERGKDLISVYLDEVTNQLMKLAYEYNFPYEPQPSLVESPSCMVLMDHLPLDPQDSMLMQIQERFHASQNQEGAMTKKRPT